MRKIHGVGIVEVAVIFPGEDAVLIHFRRVHRAWIALEVTARHRFLQRRVNGRRNPFCDPFHFRHGGSQCGNRLLNVVLLYRRRLCGGQASPGSHADAVSVHGLPIVLANMQEQPEIHGLPACQHRVWNGHARAVAQRRYAPAVARIGKVNRVGNGEVNTAELHLLAVVILPEVVFLPCDPVKQFIVYDVCHAITSLGSILNRKKAPNE